MLTEEQNDNQAPYESTRRGERLLQHASPLHPTMAHLRVTIPAGKASDQRAFEQQPQNDMAPSGEMKLACLVYLSFFFVMWKHVSLPPASVFRNLSRGRPDRVTVRFRMPACRCRHHGHGVRPIGRGQLRTIMTKKYGK